MKFSPFLLRAKALVVLSFLAVQSLAQGDEIIQTKGKEFWIGFMKNYETQADAALDIFITSDQNTTGTVSIPANGWSQTFVVSANVTTTVTVPNDMAETLTFGSVDDTGVLVETEDTVAVFAINFKSFTADGMRVLPVGALGTEYRVSSYQGLEGFDYNSEMLIIGTEDGTEIEITPSCNLSSGEQEGQTYTINLDRGESYQLKAQVWSDEVTGSLIRATTESGPCRPFAVFSGSDCPNIPYGCFACDHICEQNLPTASWGTKYFLIPFNLANSYTYKILAHEDGTQVTLNGTTLGLDAGEYAEYNDENDVICVESNLPVSAIQFMEGLDCGGVGDPAMLILDDAAQGIQNITFSTVESTVITNHNINIIINSDDVGDVSLDGALLPSSQFDDVPSCPDYSYAQIAIDEGSHTLIAPSGLTGYVYGTGGYESYAYSLGSFRSVPGVLIDEVLCETDVDTLYIGLQGDFNDIFWVNSANPEDTLGYGAQFILYPPVESGVYIGTGYEFVSGCPYEELFSIEIENQPIDVIASAADGEICQFQSTLINTVVSPENPYYNYQWIPSYGLNNPEIGNPEASPIETTTYQVNVTSPGGCNAGTASVTIEVNEGSISGLQINPNQAVLCQGEEVQLDANFEILSYFDFIGASIDMSKWQTINGGIASDDCGSGNQNAIYFNSAGGTERSATTNPMDVSQGGTIHFLLKIANGTAPCEDVDPGEDVVLQYSTGGAFNTFVTYNEALYPDFTEIAVPIPTAAYSANTRFRWIQPAFTALNEDNWALDQIYVTAVNNTAFDITWTPATGLNNPNIVNPIATPDEPTVYTINVDDGNLGCTYSDEVNVMVYEMPDIDLGPDITVCGVNDVLLDAPDANNLENLNYQWEPAFYLNTPNAQSTTLNEFANFSQVYTVTASNNGVCADTDDIFVTVIASGFGLGPDFSQCEAYDATIYSNFWEVGDILWNTGQTDNFITVTEGGTYWVTIVTDECVLSDTITITFTPGPDVDFGPDITICPDETVVLDAGEGAFYFWGDGSTDQFFEVTEPGYYNVSVYDESFLCFDSDDINITAGESPPVNIGPNQDLCEGESVTLNAGNPGATYLWSTGATSQTITVSSTGTYSVEVNEGGCVGDDEANIDVFEIPVFELGEDVLTCDDITLTLNPGDAYPNADYLWSTGATTPSITLDDDGTYWCLIENGPCDYSDTITFIPTAFEPEMKMPNVFTPDGDGNNEKFGPLAKDIKNYSLLIYNRWGDKVYESTDFNDGWNGKFNGSEMTSGTYYYLLKYEELCTGVKVDTEGTLTLLRN
ncbi:MAG: gliding motility-associated C-terminal domain-containing protein [Flavobacteriales bacterium]